jgi:hypothetical protein
MSYRQLALRNIKQAYGFTANPYLSINHNAATIVANLPKSQFFVRCTNVAVHNLCTIIPPPPNIASLLGLGFNFVPKPRLTNYNIATSCARFKTDIEMQSFLSGNTSPPDLYIKTGAQAPPHLINPSLKRRVDLFNQEIQKHFKKRKCKSNLMPFQRDALIQLRQSKTHTVFPADKNLGPCIIK